MARTLFLYFSYEILCKRVHSEICLSWWGFEQVKLPLWLKGKVSHSPNLTWQPVQWNPLSPCVCISAHDARPLKKISQLEQPIIKWKWKSTPRARIFSHFKIAWLWYSGLCLG